MRVLIFKSFKSHFQERIHFTKNKTINKNEELYKKGRREIYLLADVAYIFNVWLLLEKTNKLGDVAIQDIESKNKQTNKKRRHTSLSSDWPGRLDNPPIV